MWVNEFVSWPISSRRSSGGSVSSKRPAAMVSAWRARRRSGASSRDTTRMLTSSRSSRPMMTIDVTMRPRRLYAPKMSRSGQTMATLQPVVFNGLKKT